MCGITGSWIWNQNTTRDQAAIVKAMTDRLTHRGPDSDGIWCDQTNGIALGHRRLSIIDLSHAGHQPMVSADGRFIVTYNGEIYNFPDLRTELETHGWAFNGHSDTEVLLTAIAQWGVEKTLPKLWGMFAFALWDRTEQCLTLVRDRLGVKPLYWSLNKGVFLFGSEITALETHPDFDREINPEAVGALVRYSYIPAPASIYKHASKLPPGCSLTLHKNQDPKISAYWSFHQHAVHKLAPAPEEKEAVDEFDRIATDAVERRMISDVPLGAFFSGGIDSSLVVALMQKNATRKVRTFTIGFPEKDYDESKHARAIANHLGTDHTEAIVEQHQALDIAPKIGAMFDEPFADSSQIPTFLVSEMTRKHVTVALSGDGGDEMFAGYPRYQIAENFFQRLSPIPSAIRGCVGNALRATPLSAMNAALSLVPASHRPPRLAQRLRRISRLLALPTDDTFHDAMSSWCFNETDIALNCMGTLRHQPSAGLSEALPTLGARMQYYDTMRYLPDDILTKVDRCSMAVSLEAREPLLDHRLIEYVWALPQHYKVRNGTSKWLLRKTLDRYVPSHLFERPKMGFSVPLDAWLRGPLKDWANQTLFHTNLDTRGLLNASEVSHLWHEHQTHTNDNGMVLWNILMLQAWQTARKPAFTGN